MTRPRQILPGRIYEVSRRCTQRQFLLRPDAITNQAFTYCLGEAAQRFEIDVLLPTAMSNHHHTICFDRHGRLPQFMEHFHKMLARCLNARWGRWENLWSAEEVCATELLTPETVIKRLVYVAANPVNDHLVERASQWPGVNGYVALLAGRSLRARRPHHFFRAGGTMPAEIELKLVIPAELGDAGAVIAAVRDGVERVEAEMREERRRTGRRIVGRGVVLAASWRSSPNTPAPHRNLRPRFAGPRDMMLGAIARFHDFMAAYRSARKRWLAGIRTTFPAGTYWLSRFTPVEVIPIRTN